MLSGLARVAQFLSSGAETSAGSDSGYWGVGSGGRGQVSQKSPQSCHCLLPPQLWLS